MRDVKYLILNIIPKFIISFVVFILFFGIGLSLVRVTLESEKKDVSGVVMKHVTTPRSHYKSSRIDYDKYLIVKTDEYGLHDFNVDMTTYSMNKDGDRITFKNYPIDSVEKKELGMVDVLLGVTKTLLMLIGCVGLLVGYSVGVTNFWEKVNFVEYNKLK